MTPYKISIVTASFNQGLFIAEAIESVLAQGYPQFEHIIVDNCSTDQTSEVLKRYGHLKVICEKDKGQSDALNKGFKAATGNIIGWLNADDKYLPGCFKAVIEAMDKEPSCDVLYGDYRFVDVKGNLIRVRKELGFDLFMLKYLHVLYIPTTATFFNRKVFDEKNFLDINYHYAMDYEFFVRLAGQGYTFGHIPRVMADFRWHEQAKSQQRHKSKAEMEKALIVQDKFLQGLKPPLRSLVRDLLCAIARLKRYTLKFLSGAYFVRSS
ncbi:MAG: glycosyltransferase [Candidatus Omnitrophica bacterium]|nr:glycosyltransferase [Candidatus Omnitrophota bacterium]